MKEIVEILKKKHGEQLDALQRTANIVGVKDAERWDYFMKCQLMEIIDNDDDLMEKFVDVAFEMLVAELAIKPDPEYQLTEKEKLISAVEKLFADLDIDLEKILK